MYDPSNLHKYDLLHYTEMTSIQIIQKVFSKAGKIPFFI